VVPALPTPEDDGYQLELLRFVERFALVFTASGIPRMPARVFAYVLADDAETYTAAQLADGLRVSPAAISQAVRYLVQVGLLGREREPGSRSDVYRIYDEDVWSRIYSGQVEVLSRFEEAAADGVAVLGLDRQGGRRLEETRRFFAFMREELPRSLERWQDQRRSGTTG
jgi:DNA-binding transcriptional regulator GbsR (MarR family)